MSKGKQPRKPAKRRAQGAQRQRRETKAPAPAPRPRRRTAASPPPATPPAVQAILAPPAGDGEPRDLQAAEPPILGDIPWGYGQNRVTAMAVDPYWMFVYWEVTDDALERARDRAGASGGECLLRVYDTTYRLFDGFNASWHVDVPVYRPANNHYVAIAKPGSTFHVDIGVRGHDGAFAPIARSGAVEMPRDAVSPDGSVEWMTVAQEAPASPPYRHRFAPRPGQVAPPARPASLHEAEAEQVLQALAGEGWTRVEWTETVMGGRTVRWVQWTGPVRREAWRFHHVEILFHGEREVTRWEGGERVVLGPWTVTVCGLEPGGSRQVLDRWTIHHSWVTEGGAVRVETAPVVRRILEAYRLGMDPLALHPGGGSEALLAGASEWQWLAASEWQWRGASEWRWPGASERWLGGASEAAFAGASELGWRGASEWRWAGASEWVRMGASEWVGAGGSEWRFPAASEWRFPGASDFPGASEGRR